jgi:hypothetical protein
VLIVAAIVVSAVVAVAWLSPTEHATLAIGVKNQGSASVTYTISAGNQTFGPDTLSPGQNRTYVHEQAFQGNTYLMFVLLTKSGTNGMDVRVMLLHPGEHATVNFTA